MEALLFDVRAVSFPPDGTHWRELQEWVTALGADTRAVMPFGVITREAGLWTVHMMRKLLNEQGKWYVDRRRNLCATEAASYLVGADPSWPSWLGEVVELPTMPPSHVLEVMQHSDALPVNLASRLRAVVA